jgi:hypothetical protein
MAYEKRKNCDPHHIPPLANRGGYVQSESQWMGTAMNTICTSDIPWIAAHSTLATLLVLAWAFIPA